MLSVLQISDYMYLGLKVLLRIPPTKLKVKESRLCYVYSSVRLLKKLC